MVEDFSYLSIDWNTDRVNAKEGKDFQCLEAFPWWMFPGLQRRWHDHQDMYCFKASHETNQNKITVVTNCSFNSNFPPIIAEKANIIINYRWPKMNLRLIPLPRKFPGKLELKEQLATTAIWECEITKCWKHSTGHSISVKREIARSKTLNQHGESELQKEQSGRERIGKKK